MKKLWLVVSHLFAVAGLIFIVLLVREQFATTRKTIKMEYDRKYLLKGKNGVSIEVIEDADRIYFIALNPRGTVIIADLEPQRFRVSTQLDEDAPSVTDENGDGMADYRIVTTVKSGPGWNPKKEFPSQIQWSSKKIRD